jgi:hypothetical protein
VVFATAVLVITAFFAEVVGFSNSFELLSSVAFTSTTISLDAAFALETLAVFSIFLTQFILPFYYIYPCK